MENAYKTLVIKSKGRDHPHDPDINGRIILKWILRKQCELDRHGLGQGPVPDSCELGDKLSVHMKRGDFLNELSDYQLLKKTLLYGVR
jgi:hypothetical protein